MRLNFIIYALKKDKIHMTSSKTVVDVGEIDARFLRRLVAELGVYDLSRYFQCGVCGASCPLRKIPAREF